MNSILKNITVVVFISLVVSCSEVTKSNKVEEESIDLPNKNEFENKNILNQVDSFVDYVLKDKKSKISFNSNDKMTPRYLEIFNGDSLQSIFAYLDNRRIDSLKPYYYEDFILFVLNYNNEENAKVSYGKFRNQSQYTKEHIDSLDRNGIIDGASLVFRQSKPGGLICQKGKYIFSLVETCRNTPVGGTWKDYENLFINALLEEKESIEVLNANCGQMGYSIEVMTK